MNSHLFVKSSCVCVLQQHGEANKQKALPHKKSYFIAHLGPPTTTAPPRLGFFILKKSTIFMHAFYEILKRLLLL